MRKEHLILFGSIAAAYTVGSLTTYHQLKEERKKNEKNLALIQLYAQYALFLLEAPDKYSGEELHARMQMQTRFIEMIQNLET